MLNVTRHCGSLPEAQSASPPSPKKDARAPHDQPPSQAAGRHLLSGDAPAARQPRPDPARTGRQAGHQRGRPELLPQSADGKRPGEDEKLRQLQKQIRLRVCADPQRPGRKSRHHAPIFAAQDGGV